MEGVVVSEKLVGIVGATAGEGMHLGAKGKVRGSYTK